MLFVVSIAIQMTKLQCPSNIYVTIISTNLRKKEVLCMQCKANYIVKLLVGADPLDCPDIAQE